MIPRAMVRLCLCACLHLAAEDANTENNRAVGRHGGPRLVYIPVTQVCTCPVWPRGLGVQYNPHRDVPWLYPGDTVNSVQRSRCSLDI